MIYYSRTVLISLIDRLLDTQSQLVFVKICYHHRSSSSSSSSSPIATLPINDKKAIAQLYLKHVMNKK